jgi:hypothetical protein
MLLIRYNSGVDNNTLDPGPKPKKASKPAKSKISNDIYLRQLYVESGLGEGVLYKNQLKKRPSTSPLAVGPAQIQKVALDEYNKKYKTAYKLEDRLNPDVATKIQQGYMEDLYNKEFINKPNQSEKVRVAKTLLAYNRGPGAARAILTDLKAQGHDIYNSLDWVDKIPDVEGKKYVKNIILGFEPIEEQNYQKLVKKSTFKYK